MSSTSSNSTNAQATGARADGFTVRIRRWSAWAPCAQSDDQWREWAAGRRSLGAGGDPDVRFVPPLLRRRLSRLDRMVFQVAYGACPAEELSSVRLLLGSRHGEIATTCALLETLARDEPVSPTRFSHSVHNTAAGLFSMAASNRVGAVALAARHHTFACVLLEAVLSLRLPDSPPVLAVVADEEVPEPFGVLADERAVPHAVAWLLDRPEGAATGEDLVLRPVPRAVVGVGDRDRLPAVLVALGWLLRREPRDLYVPGGGWILSRSGTRDG